MEKGIEKITWQHITLWQEECPDFLVFLAKAYGGYSIELPFMADFNENHIV